MRAPFSLALLRAALVGSLGLLAGCGLCDRDTEADGVYQLATDCTGSLLHGSIQIGGSGDPGGTVELQSATCVPVTSAATLPDGGVHDTSVPSPDAGSPPAADAGPASPTLCRVTASKATESTGMETCAETTAYNARALGLPSQVRVEGQRTFELHGEVGGRYLDCTPERFGDERILMCRYLGRVACVAVLEERVY